MPCIRMHGIDAALVDFPDVVPFHTLLITHSKAFPTCELQHDALHEPNDLGREIGELIAATKVRRGPPVSRLPRRHDCGVQYRP